MYASVIWEDDFDVRLSDKCCCVVHFRARGGCVYTNSYAYAANGDPGEPGEEEYEVDEIDFTEVCFYNPVTDEDLPQRVFTDAEAKMICSTIEYDILNGAYEPCFD